MRSISSLVPVLLSCAAAAGCSHPSSSAGASEQAVLSGPTAPVLFVGNFGDGTVSLVDEVTLAEIGRVDVIPDGATPRDPTQAALYENLVKAKGVSYVQGLAVSPDARTLYVSRGYLGDVVAVDLATRALRWRVQVPGIRADHLALSPDGERLFVSAITASVVDVIDTGKGELASSFSAGTYPHVLHFTPDGSRIVVGSMGNPSAPAGSEGERALTFVDPLTLQIERKVTFDAGVRPFVFSPDGAVVYLQLSFLNGFLAVSASSGETEHVVALPVVGPALVMRPEDYPNQAAHHGIAISGDGSTICAAATVSSYVALVDRAGLSLTTTVDVGAQPAEAETSLDGLHCLVSNRGQGEDSVSVISYEERREVARIPVGARPQELAQAHVPRDVLRRYAY